MDSIGLNQKKGRILTEEQWVNNSCETERKMIIRILFG